MRSGNITKGILFSCILPLGAAWPIFAQETAGKAPAAPRQKEAKPELPKCPVMGEEVDFFVKTMTPEGPVYFCCPKCIDKFTADPAKYAKEVAEQRKALAGLPKIQIKCPLTGKALNPKAFVEKDGAKTFFCSRNCLEMYEKDPAKYVAALADCYTYQTQCPVSGKAIDPAMFIDLKSGQRIYFCCDKCEKPFLAEPGKFVASLEEQGTHVDPKKVEVAATKPHP